MRWKKNLIYDGFEKITIEYSYSKVTIKSNGRITVSDLVEREFVKLLPKLVVIDNNTFITEYDDIAILVYKGKMKRLDKDIGKYLSNYDELPEL
jgi:hypothetical protein